MFNMTADLIRKHPLRRGAKLDEIVKWILSVAPCLVPGYKQSAEDTDMIVWHLKRNGINTQTIAAALIGTDYQWTVRDISLSAAMLNKQMELDGVFSRNSNTRTPQSYGRPGTPNTAALKEKARELESEFQANAHDPDRQERILNSLIDILKTVGGNRVEEGEIAPGSLRAAREWQRVLDTGQEILLNAPNLARIVRNLGPLDLDRIRRGGQPGGNTGRRINPNAYRTTPARRAR